MRKRFAFLCMIFIFGCQPAPKERVYREYDSKFSAAVSRPVPPKMASVPSLSSPSMDMANQDPAMQRMLMNSVADVTLTWDTPSGWQQLAGSGMRLATFKDPDFPEWECSIITLAGDAGGAAFNISRWIGQIGLQPLSPDQLNQFVQSLPEITSQGGLQGILVDLSAAFQPADDSQPWIMGAIFQNEGNAIFLKMTGSARSVQQNRDKFLSLIQSLR